MIATSERTPACGCAAATAPAPPTERRAGPICLALSLAFAALVPKCPMCLAAYLSLVGIGGGMASLAHPWLRPLSVLLIVVAAVVVIAQRWRASRGI